MTLAIRLNGFDYKGFKSAIVSRNMEEISGDFSFTTTAKNSNFIPIREGDEVEIIADDSFKIMTGFIDSYELEYDDKTHEISVKGRSKTLELIDSTIGVIDPVITVITEFEKIGLVELCEIIASDFGITVINEAGTIKPFDDIVSAEIGQTAFNFLESFARKRQVLLTDNAAGNLVITRASTEVSPNNLQNRIGILGNNIKKGFRSVNIANLYHKYIVQGQLNPIKPLLGISNTPQVLVEQSGSAIDDEIRKTRKLEFFAEETMESATLEDRAKWEMSIRRARNFTYSATVQGHTFNGVLWETNIIHQIDDDFSQIRGEFLCNQLTYEYNLTDGSTTKLNFTNVNSYTLESEKDTIKIDAEEF